MSADEIAARREKKPKNAIVILLDSLNRSHAWRVRRAQVRHAQPRRFRAPRSSFRPCHYSGSLLCIPGASRHSLRRDRFFVEAVGLTIEICGSAHG